MEESSSDERSVDGAAGAAGVRSDEEVELEAMSVEQLRSLIVRERREREAARSPIVIASTVTQGEPGPLTVSGQTGVFFSLWNAGENDRSDPSDH